MTKLTLTLLVLAGTLQGAFSKIPEEQEWKDGLGSSDFQKRKEASSLIWKAGDRALDVLMELANGDDPEIAARAEKLLLNIRAGLRPDTPDEVVALVHRFFLPDARLRSKVAILEELRRLERFEFILRLRSLETDELVVEKADEIIEEVLPKLVRQFTVEEKFDEVKALLLLGSDFASMIAYANLLDNLGELEQGIERLRDSKDSLDQKRYLACLRVKGDAPLLLSEARRLGDKQAESLAALVLGDHLPYFEYLSDSRSLNLAARGYLDWTIAQARGDREEAKRAEKALIHLTKNDEEIQSARKYLFRMGLPEVVMEGVEADEVDDLYGFYLGQEQYAKILPLFGIKDGVLTEEWLESQRLLLEDKNNNSRLGSKLASVMGFYESRGMLEEAVRCCEVMIAAARKDQEIKLANWFAFMISYGPKSGIRTLAKEVEKHGFDLELGMETIFRSPNISWVFNQVKEIYPAKSIEQQLLLAASFGGIGRGSGHVLYVSEDDFEDAQKRLTEVVMDSGDQVGGLKKLFGLASIRDSERDLVKFGELLDEHDGERPPSVLAKFEVKRMHFEKAGKFMQEVDYDGTKASPNQLYFKGAALRKAGLPGGEELCRRGMQLSKGGSEELLEFSGIEGQFHFDEEAHQLNLRSLLRRDISQRDSSELNSKYTNLYLLASGAMKRKQWAVAEALWEALAWESGSSGAIYNLRNRFHILLARGARKMEAGELVAAVRDFTRAHELIPRDGYLANDFFPLVREFGLGELHDQLFAISARECRKVIELYPRDDNAYNNFAWLASRANRSLDEAEEYLKKALELEPRSAAYLDTMGEIYFARRDRKEAVRWSDLSRSYELSDVELQGQNLRFKHGDFPPR